MKLYAWQPRGHGEYSFFVCAENEKDAKDAVDSYIKEQSISDYSSSGFGTDYYFLTVLEPLQVVSNCND